MNSDSLLASKVKTGYGEAHLSEDGSEEVYSQHRDGQHVSSQMPTHSSIIRHPEAGEPCQTQRSGVNHKKGHTLDTQRSANHPHAAHPSRGQPTSGSCLNLTGTETKETEKTPHVRALPPDSSSSSSDEEDLPIYPPWRSYLISRQCANPPDIKVDFLDMVECGDSRAASAYKLTSRFDDRPVGLTTPTACLDPILEDPATPAKETRRPRHQILKQFATRRNGFSQILDTSCNTARENDKNKPTQNANKPPVDMTKVTTGKPTKLFLAPNGKLTYQGSPSSGRSTPVSSDDSASNRLQRDNKGRTPLQAGREGSAEGLVPERPRDGRDMSFKAPSSLSSSRHNPVLSNVNSSCFQETGEHSNPPAHQQANKEFPVSKLRSAKVNTSLAEADKKRLKELFPAVRCRIQESGKRQETGPAKRRQGTNQGCSTRALKTLAPLVAATSTQRDPQPVKNTEPGLPRLKIMEKGKCKGERVLTPRPHRVRPYRMMRKGMRLPASRTVKKMPENFNINFNSETDGNEEDAQSYSFIGYYFYELWKNQCMCDVRLKVGNTSFLAHKLVLAAFSDLFHPEDPSQMPTLCFDIQDVSEEAICLILQYLYTNKMEITEAVLESVYTAARVLEIEEVQDLVLRILSRPTLENFEKYMGIRQRVGITGSIMEVFREFVQENLMSIQDSAFIMNLGIAEIEQLLQDEDVKVESEEDVVHFILKWIKYNPCQRSIYMSQLLSLVNYDCISPDILASIVEQNRDLFDLASMDIMMRAFKKYALNCKVPPGYSWKDNGSSSNCAITGNCTSGANCSSANNYAEGATCTSFRNACGDKSEVLNEGPDDIVEFQEAVEDDYPHMEPARCMRRYTAISPQDIRRNARKLFYNQDCSSYEPQPSGFRTLKLGCKRRCSGDSSNNFPEYIDSRSRSASVESKSSQGSNGSRRPSVSRSYTDMGPPKFRGGSGGGGGGLKENPAITKMYSTRGGRPFFDTGEPEVRGGSENGWCGRNEGRRVRRGPENCPSYLRSRSSSRSSESSLKQSPSTKRVTFV